MTGTVLIVNDDQAMAQRLDESLGREGWRIVSATAETARPLLARDQFDVVLIGPGMDAIEGLALLRPVDYLMQPFRPGDLTAALRRAIDDRAANGAPARLRRHGSKADDFEDLIGTSRAMRSVVEDIRAIADTEAAVLLLGESGTGKELVARAVHQSSQRRAGPFIAVNCAAIPEPLLESELFGHVKGAFTGADRARRGLFADANGGTLFLDEIVEMPFRLQSKLLRVLQDKVIRPVGGGPEVQLDFRVVSATNRDLALRVQEGTFREDLYYRLAVMPIRLPSLRERPEDVPVLARHFLARLAAERGCEAIRFTEDAERALAAHSWPGNVRELQNAVERAATLAQGPAISAANLALEAAPAGVAGSRVRPTIDALTRRYVEQVLAETNGDKPRAARVLGVSVRTLQRWFKAR